MPKLENIDIAVSLKNVVMGEVDTKRKGFFKSQPIDITEKFEKVAIEYLEELEGKSFEYEITKDEKSYIYKVSLEIEEKPNEV